MFVEEDSFDSDFSLLNSTRDQPSHLNISDWRGTFGKDPLKNKSMVEHFQEHNGVFGIKNPLEYIKKTNRLISPPSQINPEVHYELKIYEDIARLRDVSNPIFSSKRGSEGSSVVKPRAGLLQPLYLRRENHDHLDESKVINHNGKMLISQLQYRVPQSEKKAKDKKLMECFLSKLESSIKPPRLDSMEKDYNQRRLKFSEYDTSERSDLEFTFSKPSTG